MKTIYLDCFSGASGDMLLGAFLDAGADETRVRQCLARLPIEGYELDVQKVKKGTIDATRATVRIDEDTPQPDRHLDDLTAVIKQAGLSETVESLAVEVFTRLATAESEVHGIPLDEIHFHEVGAVDSIVDVVGNVLAVESLGPARTVCSPMHLGAGEVHCAHGLLPVPAPATLSLLRGVPVYSQGISAELVTPTGAALVTTLAAEFGPIPAMAPLSIGYGAGSRDLEGRPNVLRAVLGEATDEARLEQSMAVVETNIDDMNPQWYEPLMAKLFAAGARDMFMAPAWGKKHRPGTLLTVLCPEETVPEIARLVFRETTTFGIRYRVDRRIVIERESVRVQTPWGEVSVKVGTFAGETVSVSPEYEECRRLADQTDVPVKRVYEAAIAAGFEQGHGD